MRKKKTLTLMMILKVMLYTAVLNLEFIYSVHHMHNESIILIPTISLIIFVVDEIADDEDDMLEHYLAERSNDPSEGSKK